MLENISDIYCLNENAFKIIFIRYLGDTYRQVLSGDISKR